MIKVGRTTYDDKPPDSTTSKDVDSTVTIMPPHKYEVIDTDPSFIIDGDTREIINASEVRIVLMQGDHNSERLTFTVPRYIDSHDMSTCNICQIHYLNVASDNKNTITGVYEVDDLQVDSENADMVTLSWLISSNVTQLIGKVSFVVRFACSTEDIINYVWNTAIYSGITVSSSIYNSDEIIMEYADVLEEWRQKLFTTYETAIIMTLKNDAWIASSDQLYYTQDIVIPNSTEKTKIDLQPTPDQLIMLISRGITIFVSNDNGNIKVYSINDKPPTDITLQATMKEVSL